MKGIGVDIVQIERIKTTIEKQGDRFVKRILTASEQELYHQRKQSVSFLANRFAAKEAVAKALGTGIAQGVGFEDMEILPNEAGQPIVALFNSALARFQALGAEQIHISISDEKDYAVAFVTLN